MSEFESKVVAWIDERKKSLCARGFINVGLNKSEAPGSVAIDIETKNVVSTICVWFSGSAELLVLNSSTGKTLTIEEVDFVDVNGLYDLLDRWIRLIESE